MSGTTTLAVALAVLGAGCFAGAAALQHRAVATVAGGTGGLGPAHLRALVARPGWLGGLAFAAAGTGLHALALVLAPLSVVQPVGVLAVPFAVLLTARRSGRRPAAGVLAGVALAVGGVAGFVALTASNATSGPVPDGGVALAVAAATGLAVVLVVVGATARGRARCVAAATAGAAAFGLVSALVRAVALEISTGAAGPTDPWVLATAGAIVAGVAAGAWLVQQAFVSGPPAVVVACLTVVDPIVAVLLGVLLLGEVAATSAAVVGLLATAAALAAAGVLALARHHPDVTRPTAPPPRPVAAVAAQPVR